MPKKISCTRLFKGHSWNQIDQFQYIGKEDNESKRAFYAGSSGFHFYECTKCGRFKITEYGKFVPLPK